jgi:tetratricopeptide (TPR) repeat protein
MEMIQLALVDNNPGGALRAIASAQKDGLFGQPGKAEREQRLIALANKTAGQTKASLDQNDKDLTASPSTTAEQLFDLGQNYASFGDYQKGTNLMQEAIAKGGLSRPAQAQLRLGEALINAGQKGAAMEALRKVPDTTDGTSGLAKMWLLWLRTQSTLSPTPA